MSLTDSDAGFGALVKTFRRSRRRTQQHLADALGVHRSTLFRWERGDYLPESKAQVLELARHLDLDDQEARQLLEASLTAPSPYWSVPLPRNPYFTGREEILEVLHTQLGVDQAVALTQSSALHGLGGVGKTQTALEYAYRHALDYRAVFWMAAETDEQIVTSFLRVAWVLGLPEHDENDQQRVVAAVQHWLISHDRWLLIWDNVEDLDLLHRFLPAAGSGALLITTRCQLLGTLARGIDLVPMEQEEGVLFLLRRAKVLSPEATREQLQQFAERMLAQYAVAVEMVSALGGLPLALDQAGAYLEKTRCGLPAYLDRFRSRRVALLKLRGDGSCTHPESVSATLRLSIIATAQHHPAVLDLLRVCAFLQPDAIPEEFFHQGAEHLGAQLQAVCRDILEWDQVVGVAYSYSLLSRQTEEQTLSIHRLVQAVLVDAMTAEEREQWSARVIVALNMAIPEVWHTTEYAVWKQCERLLPHALLCLQRARSAPESLPLASIAHKTACYLLRRGRYREAEPLFQRALSIREQVLGPEHPEVAASLNNLAALSWERGKYAEAEPFSRRALQIWEQALGPEHLQVAISLDNLAELSWGQGKYAEAELLYRRALSIREQALGPEHPHIAELLHGLANLSRDQGKYAEAEPLYQRALQIVEQTLGPEHPDIATSLTGLAECYRLQRWDAEAEPLYQRALQIWEQALGPEHPGVADSLNGLANLSRDQSHYPEAERLYRRILSLREQHLGQSHPDTAQTLHDLAILRQKQSCLREAISLTERALQIRLQALGEAHPKTLATQALYSQLLQERGDGAEPILEQLRTLLKARGWSVHLKKRRGRPYVYATRKVGQHTQSHYLAPLSNLAACLAAASMLPNAKE